MIFYARAIIAAARHNGRASGGAIRRSGIEALEAQSVSRHSVEMRRFEDRVVPVSHLAPALIVSHYENDIGSRITEDERRGDET